MPRLVCGSAMLLMAVLALPQRVPAQDLSPAALSATPLLDLPFVPQSEVLCGGAALAMVLRHHGVRGVEAEDFRHLVIDPGIGIRTTDLTNAARERGLEATPFAARRDIVRALLAAGDPVIALIENRPGVYHYVVLLAWGEDRVLFHDPAVGPHQVMREAELMRAWQPAGYWALRTRAAAAGPSGVDAQAHERAGADTLIARRPAADAPAPAPRVRSDTSSGAAAALDPCTALLQSAAAAVARDLREAERALEEARHACRDASIVARERAGLRFRQGRYADAEADAQQRIARAPDDVLAWELLAASRFLRGERNGALAAWNRIGRPYSDLTRIEGLRRTPYAVVSDAVAIAPGTLITSDRLARARRRTSAVPAIARARIDYRPITADTAHVDVSVLEHAMLPLRPLDLALHAVRGLSEQRVLVRPANLLRLGERWRIDATWQENRRALALGVSVPRVLGMHAVTHLDAGVYDRAFADPVGGTDAVLARETIRYAALRLSDWASGRIAWQGGVGLEEWPDRRLRGSAAAGGALHAGEHLVIGGDVSGWWAPGVEGAVRARVDAELRTSPARRTEWLVVLHGAVTSADAPRALWNGAGTGRIDGALLRAHPLLADDGSIRSPWWAPRLAAGTIEMRQWLTRLGPLDIGAAAFVDGALAGGAAGAGTPPGAVRGAVDAGAGLRLRLADGPTIRIDAAHGIGSSAHALSISLGRGMP